MSDDIQKAWDLIGKSEQLLYSTDGHLAVLRGIQYGRTVSLKAAELYLSQAQMERQQVGSGHLDEAIGRLTGAQIVVNALRAGARRERPQNAPVSPKDTDATG